MQFPGAYMDGYMSAIDWRFVDWPWWLPLRRRWSAGGRSRGCGIARIKGRLKGRPPKLSPAREEHVVQLYEAGEYTTSEIAKLLRISRSTVYRAVKRAAKAKLAPTS